MTDYPFRPGTSPILIAAFRYAERGWAVLPLHNPITRFSCSCDRHDCTSIGKHPRTTQGLKNASLDHSMIRRWWSSWPDANVAILTGSASGLVVLDVDPRHDGDKSLSVLEDCAGLLPPTPQARTGGGGRHVFFAHPGPTVTIRNAVNVGGSPGLDVRGDAGYVVAPPSKHVSGARYMWIPGSSPNELELASMPKWMIDATLTTYGCSRTGAESRDLPLATIPKGQRNHDLTSLAGTMRRRGMTVVAIRAALLAENRLRCDPPLPEAEVERIAKSIGRYAPALRGIPSANR